MTVDNYVDQLVDDATTTLRKLTKSTMRDLYNESFDLGFTTSTDKLKEDRQESFRMGHDDGYAAGVEDAWEAAKKLHAMSPEERLQTFGYSHESEVFILDPVDAIKQLSKPQEPQVEFSKIPVIGDEVALSNLAKFVVTHYDSDLKTVDGIMLDGTTVSDISIDAVKRTGRIYGQFAEFFAKEK